MTLKLLTLNIEADRHLDRVRSVIAEHLPDVVCLQEVLEKDLPELARIGPYQARFAVSARVEGPGPRGALMECHWGEAVLTRVPVHSQVVTYYADDPRIRMLRAPNDPRRLVIMTELVHEGQTYRIGTTHFTWSVDGDISAEQRADFARLKRVLSEYPDYVLCGDFNAPRGREMFDLFRRELALDDHLPPHIRSTLDPVFHRARGLELAVDTIFSTREYRATDVEVLEGISDHKAILATLARAGS
jgi:endonuclease/exonuclease/phosphatase family metal-dependent hydrolase